MRVVVFGGRNYSDWERVWDTMNRVHRIWTISTIIEGGAPGADALARRWAKRREVALITVEADWDDIEAPGAVCRINRAGRYYNAVAGHWRNQKMVDLRPDMAIGFPGGSGTADMWRRVKRGVEEGKIKRYLEIK